MSELYKDLDLTTFPEGVDSFTQWLDITASDGPLIRQYMNAIESGNMTLANQILIQIPSGTQKIIKANDLNKMTQAILATERFYKENVQDYVQNKQNEWNRIINQFTYKGVWSNGTSYLKNNMVSYTIFGTEYIYIAKDNIPAGVAPDDGQFWKVLTIQGQQGISGEGLSYREQWKVSNAYNVNDAVTYNGALWMAVLPSQGVEPTQSSSAWKIIMSLATTTYPIQNTQPANQIAGDLWFNTQGNPTKYYYLPTLQNPANAEDIVAGKEVYNDQGEIIIGTAV